MSTVQVIVQSQQRYLEMLKIIEFTILNLSECLKVLFGFGYKIEPQPNCVQTYAQVISSLIHSQLS